MSRTVRAASNVPARHGRMRPTHADALLREPLRHAGRPAGRAPVRAARPGAGGRAGHRAQRRGAAGADAAIGPAPRRVREPGFQLPCALAVAAHAAGAARAARLLATGPCRAGLAHRCRLGRARRLRGTPPAGRLPGPGRPGDAARTGAARRGAFRPVRHLPPGMASRLVGAGRGRGARGSSLAGAAPLARRRLAGRAVAAAQRRTAARATRSRTRLRQRPPAPR
jgi:hypothetical protein